MHRRQVLPAPAPVHYSGSPLAVDFGEQDNTSVVCLVEADPGTPGHVAAPFAGSVTVQVAEGDAV